MAKVIGFAKQLLKKFTCYNCTAIVEYSPREEEYTNLTDEGTKIKGLNCPNCGKFHRTNP